MAATVETLANYTSKLHAARELGGRMQRPQRHRLLHGYPLRAAMSSASDGEVVAPVHFNPGSRRQLLVGVLAHPFCNPTVAGCGFCTFPHQAYGLTKARSLVAHVVREIRGRLERDKALRQRPVAALYFGGATANLTPADSFRELCRELAAAFDLSGAEVTLEGVPIYFVRRDPSLMDILREELPARHFRISMGIQTFSEAQLQRMGRTAFGDASTFEQAVKVAHRAGFTASADLLFNLPNQSLEQMRHDVMEAIDIGLDHLGLYHLVLFEGLGTVWSRDGDMLAGLPSNDAAAKNWLELREQLLAMGYCQTTLTNFERTELQGNERRFLYEELSYQPERVDVLGFGPTAISFAADRKFRSARKTLNPEPAAEYMLAVSDDVGPAHQGFDYKRQDLRILYLTRRLAALDIDRAAYTALFESDPIADFPDELDALESEGLIELAKNHVRPTPLGMFYADSVAGLLAWRRLKARRQRAPSSVLSLPLASVSNPQFSTLRSEAAGWLSRLSKVWDSALKIGLLCLFAKMLYDGAGPGWLGWAALAVLIVVLVVAGGIFFLSFLPESQPENDNEVNFM